VRQIKLASFWAHVNLALLKLRLKLKLNLVRNVMHANSVFHLDWFQTTHKI